MKHIVEKIYRDAHKLWEGDFKNLAPEVQDMAFRHYLAENPALLEEIFPTCCSGGGPLLIEALYEDQFNRFDRVYRAMSMFKPLEEVCESEALSAEKRSELKRLLMGGSPAEMTDFWKVIIYRYCRNALCAACDEWYRDIDREHMENLLADMQLMSIREAACEVH